ncbi:nucleotidyltransferase [Pontibacillus salicampi]|uniref:tRNA(Met) cytidine acetate ligase n=1 Tax=Pontibacillus salicampi TaxID=1449801 RepID=A0ABV6LNY5_9BACI
MKASGLIVEYNPFHYGHLYHYQMSKEASNADVTIAVMSGNFLQRGEPAIMDKWHRAQLALLSGIDIVVELPYVFAVQNSDLFAKGAVLTLDALQVDSICFGSEQGSISPFIDAYYKQKQQHHKYNHTLQAYLQQGYSYPEASKMAYASIGLTTGKIDLSKPNNILGFSYVKSILEHDLSITPLTIQRKQANYHDEEIEHTIASATSIRKAIFNTNSLEDKVQHSLPDTAVEQLKRYKNTTGVWHEWESYFPLLQYIVTVQSPSELRSIHGMEEGLEHRLQQTVLEATSFTEWMHMLKTKRYTWTRLQRVITHLFTNTKKDDVELLSDLDTIPYVRLLGMTKAGRDYIHHIKKDTDTPLLTKLHKMDHPFLTIEEKAMDSYYTILTPPIKKQVRKREFHPPLLPDLEL